MKGEVTVEELTDNPERLKPGSTFELASRTLTISSRRRHHDILLLKFDGVDTRNAAEALRGEFLTIDSDARRSLSDNEYWPEDLSGMRALLPDGTQLGTVTGVALGPQDRLIITTGSGGSVEIPFVEELVSNVHPSGGFVVVNPPPGLVEGEPA